MASAGGRGTELRRLAAGEIAAGVAAGEVAAGEVLEAYLDRLRETEPEVAAFLDVYEEGARERAGEIDRRAARGEPLGPLAGVPVAVKDNLSLAGRPLTCGSKILAGYLAPYTATAIERLEGADAVVVGKTNLDEFAMGSSCETSAFGPTRNPWNRERVPGGSSGGSAAAVAAGSVPLALGSDTGGSIRQPAALCGVVGVKGTYGRVSRYGLVAFGSSLDQVGPLARNVRDAALALSVIAGPDERDATASSRPVGDYLAEIDEGIEGWRLGVLREVDVGALPAAVASNWQQTLERLTGLGAELVEVSVANLPAAVAAYYVVANCEASANLARFDGVRYGRRAAAPEDLADLYVSSRSEGFGPEVKRRIMLGTFALSAGYYEAYYGRARAVVEAMRRQLATAFGSVDLLLAPTSPSGAFALGERVDDPMAMYLSDVFTTPASLCGLPAIAVPSGVDEEGLPLSLQIMACPFEEAKMFRAAFAFERSLGWTVGPAFALP